MDLCYTDLLIFQDIDHRIKYQKNFLHENSIVRIRRSDLSIEALFVEFVLYFDVFF